MGNITVNFNEDYVIAKSILEMNFWLSGYVKDAK
jgi:hypothetical protein